MFNNNKKFWYFVMLLIVVLAFLSWKSSNADTPKLEFDEATCSVRVTARGAPQLENCFICINGNNVGVHDNAELMNVFCEITIGTIPANEWLDISPFVECDKVVEEVPPTWGTLKASYR